MIFSPLHAADGDPARTKMTANIQRQGRKGKTVEDAAAMLRTWLSESATADSACGQFGRNVHENGIPRNPNCGLISRNPTKSSAHHGPASAARPPAVDT